MTERPLSRKEKGAFLEKLGVEHSMNQDAYILRALGNIYITGRELHSCVTVDDIKRLLAHKCMHLGDVVRSDCYGMLSKIMKEERLSTICDYLGMYEADTKKDPV